MLYQAKQLKENHWHNRYSKAFQAVLIWSLPLQHGAQRVFRRQEKGGLKKKTKIHAEL